jgi:lantibiotic modifying enzyme
MIRRARWLATACALLLPASSAWTQALPPAQSDYLDAAVGLGEWLLDTTLQGRRWIGAVLPDGTLRGASTIGLEAGAAGIGLFWLGLHDHTGDPKWLDYAKLAAEYEHTRLAQGNDNGPDYLSGAAGSGLFMLALHERTGDPQHLAWARDYAAWLDADAIRPVAGERYWKHAPDFPKTYTGIPHGAAGVAIFHASLAQQTGDAAYLEAAADAYRWVRHHALPLGGGDAIGFKRLIDDPAVYNWWSGGSAGIMQVQSMLYGLTADATYLDDLRRTADGLVLLADAAPPRGVYWNMHGDAATFRPTVFSHGSAGIPPALLLAHEYLRDPDYRATVDASVDWYEAIARNGAQNGAGGVFWEHAKNSGFGDLQTTTAFLGTSSIGWTMARMYPVTRDARMKDLALRSADYMLGIGESLPDGRRRWISYTSADNTQWGPKEYSLGWYDGNAGIGMFLLSAHELASGQRPRLDVHAP